MKAICWPFGDQAGICAKLGATSLVSWVGAPLPSAFIV
jgi:hypothetical protein